MVACWNGKLKINEVIKYAKTTYFKHPSQTNWMDDKIKDWAKKDDNKSKIKQAESKTSVEHQEKRVKADLNKFKKTINEIKSPLKK